MNFTLAACKGQTHLFFAPHNERPNARMRRETAAVALCKVCPLINECAAYADATETEYGIWGGVARG